MLRPKKVIPPTVECRLLLAYNRKICQEVHQEMSYLANPLDSPTYSSHLVARYDIIIVIPYLGNRSNRAYLSTFTLLNVATFGSSQLQNTLLNWSNQFP